MLPDFERRMVRKPVDLYSLIGAIDLLTEGGEKPTAIKQTSFSSNLRDFESQIRAKIPQGDAARYLIAASRQTDNIGPRQTRIEIMSKILRGVL